MMNMFKKTAAIGGSLTLNEFIHQLHFADGSEKRLVQTYDLYPFIVSILLVNNEKYYLTSLRLKQSDINSLADIVQDFEGEDALPNTLPSSLQGYLEWVESIISPRVACFAIPSLIARFAAFHVIGLSRLYPIIEDDDVDELFVDSLTSRPYIEHRTQGRCWLPFLLNKRELDSIRTLSEVYSSQQATLATPSMKTELDFGKKVRIGIDLPPLAPQGPAIHLRKIGGNAFTICRLLKQNALSIEAAAFLVAAAHCRLNLTIIGPSGSGKTTLLNAIDMSLDPRLRRVYIEDAIESLELEGYGYRQLKLRVEPLETGSDPERNKMQEVLKSLHRSPDILILGEIQDKMHCQAMFQSLEAGIIGLQTFHASSPEQAVRRWLNVMDVKEVQLNDLGLIITMKRPDQLSSSRILSRISEIDPDCGVRDIYARDAGGKGLATPSSRLKEKVSNLSSKDIEKAYDSALTFLSEAIKRNAIGFSEFISFFRSYIGEVGSI